MFFILTFVRFVFILVSIMLDRMEGYRGGGVGDRDGEFDERGPSFRSLAG